MENDPYQALLLNLQLPINCLTDQDRHTRRQGLDTLHKELKKTSKQYQTRLFTTSHLPKNLIHTLSDPIENNRQLTLNILGVIVDGAQFSRDYSEPIVQALIGRVNATPYPEKSQDLREVIIKLLKTCMKFKDSVIPNMSELAVAMTKCLADPSSTIKNLTCELIIEVSTHYKDYIGKYSLTIVKTLADNLKHNKYQVRKTTLMTISRIMVTSEAGANIEHLQLPLKNSVSDPKIDVRKAAIECIAYLLNYMAVKYLKHCEAYLVSYLLIALNDENHQNSDRCRVLMEQCGSSLKEMQVESTE